MKISWVPEDENGMSALHAAPGIYDGAPGIASLLVDGSPGALSVDRIGVAGALVFARYTSGSLELPRPVSPAVAQAIQGLVPDTWLLVSPVNFEAVALPVGTGTLLLSSRDSTQVSNSWGRARQIVLDVRRSDRFSGHLFSMDEVILASNAWLHAASEEPSSIDYYLGHLAVATLFAESLQVDEIVLPGQVDLVGDRAKAVVALLASTRLGLSTSAALRHR